MRLHLLRIIVVVAMCVPSSASAKSVWDLVSSDVEGTAKAFDQLYETCRKLAADSYAGFKQVWADVSNVRARARLRDMHDQLLNLAGAKVALADGTEGYFQNPTSEGWAAVIRRAKEFTETLNQAKPSLDQFSNNVSGALPEQFPELGRSLSATSDLLEGYRKSDFDTPPSSKEELQALEMWSHILRREYETIILSAKILRGFIETQFQN